MSYYRYRALLIDLSKKESITKTLNKSLVDRTLGGCALGAALVCGLLPQKIDPLSDENIIVLIPGALTGTPVPTASKTSFFTISPLTGGWLESVTGGSIGVELRSCGFEALIVKGKSEEPCVIRISDGKVSFEDASGLWGRDTFETTDSLIKGGYSTACIGQAGENLVKIACVECDGRQAGRGGLGAVFGSKRLKGIAIKGRGDIEPENPDMLESLVSKWYGAMLSHPSYQEDTRYGSGEFLNWVNSERGTFPTKNWQLSVFERREQIDPYYWSPKYSVKNNGCISCVKPCGKMFMVKDGKHAGTKVDGPEYETLYSLGGNILNSDIEVLAKANELCDRYGMDTISTGCTIAFAMELYERGIITRDETGYDIIFGDESSIITTIEKIAKREGFGDILAEGSAKASKQIGRGSERYAIHVKGMEPPAYDARGLKGMALAYAISPRGACHLRAGVYGIELTGKWWKFSGIDRYSTDRKGEMVATMDDLMSLYDTLGICKFSRHVYLVDSLPDLVECVTGIRYSTEELFRIGAMANRMKKIINIRAGFSRKDDSLPPRILLDPIPEGPSKGSKVSEEELSVMLDDYYEAKGWDRDGNPSEEQIKEAEDLTKEMFV
jgi:aldehyde:ferredoxin oxidoreductase